MDLKYAGRSQPKRVSPFEGLIIDAQTWADAHDYHLQMQRLHSLALHGHGIVDGLWVHAGPSGDSSVIITPGIAIDPDGSLILVTQPQRYHLQMDMRGASYLVIEFREIPAAPAGNGAQAKHVLEAYQIQQRNSLPSEPHLELARFHLDGNAPGVRDAAVPSNPQPNEVDLRFRQQTVIRPRGQITVGVVGRGANGWHQGLANLARELEMQGDCRVTFTGAADLRRGTDLYTLLYLDGSQPLLLDQYDITALSLFLESGGVLMSESCSASGSTEPAGAFIVLKAVTQKLNIVPKLVEWGHPILNSRYPFSAVPPGAETNGTFLEEAGVIFSSLDFGCAWQGGHPDKRLPRSAIREALEFGVNIVLYAEHRKRVKSSLPNDQNRQ